MIHNTPKTSFDFSNFNLTSIAAQDVQRSAELARSDYLAAKIKNGAQRISAAYRSAGEVFSFAQRQNQAARL
jgi:hypothetical protein